MLKRDNSHLAQHLLLYHLVHYWAFTGDVVLMVLWHSAAQFHGDDGSYLTVQEDAQDVIELMQGCLLDETGLLDCAPENFAGAGRKGKKVRAHRQHCSWAASTGCRLLRCIDGVNRISSAFAP